MTSKLDHDIVLHDLDKTKKPRIAGEDRFEVGNSIIAHHSKSTANYINAKNLKSSNIPNYEAIRKCVAQVLTKEMQSTNWITNILQLIDTYKKTMPAKMVK